MGLRSGLELVLKKLRIFLINLLISLIMMKSNNLLKNGIRLRVISFNLMFLKNLMITIKMDFYNYINPCILDLGHHSHEWVLVNFPLLRFMLLETKWLMQDFYLIIDLLIAKTRYLKENINIKKYWEIYNPFSFRLT